MIGNPPIQQKLFSTFGDAGKSAKALLVARQIPLHRGDQFYR
jgi:hypothetical protein